MGDKLRCEIVRDLLPSYVEGLTSPVTSQAVKDHLTGCPDCDEMAKRMKSPEPERAATAEEVNYLKGLRRHTWKRVLAAAVTVALVLGLVFFWRTYLVGRTADEQFMSCGASVDGDQAILQGVFLDDSMACGGVRWTEEDGVLTAEVNWVESSIFSRHEIYSQYEAKGDIRQIWLGDRILWEDGVSIHPNVSPIYAAAHPYIGDASANGELAAALGIADRLGAYTHELQTDQEPYGWTIVLEESFSVLQKNQIHAYMDTYSCAMLALVDNLGYVSWEYETEWQRETYTVTAQQAAQLTGQDVKLWGRSAVAFQELTELLGLNRSGVREPAPMGSSFQLVFELESEQKISTLELSYGLNEEMLGSMGTQRADGSVFERGEDITFELQEENFQTGTDSMDLAYFCFTLEAVTEDGERLVVAEQARPQPMYGWTYSYTIVDDGNGGLTLREG